MSELIHFQWVNALNTGIAKIDRVHQTLINSLNHFIEIQAKGFGSPQEILDAIDRLHEYAKNHFREEELLMELIEFPEVNEHILLHQGFMNEISAFRDRHKAGEIVVIDEIALFSYRWFLNHISFQDQKIADHLLDVLHNAREEFSRLCSSITA